MTETDGLKREIGVWGLVSNSINIVVGAGIFVLPAIVAEQLGVKIEEVTNEASFVDDLGADSLDTVELVMALEEEFDCEIPDEEAEKITTVQLAIDYVKEKNSDS